MPRRLTLQDAQEAALRKGGVCLSDEYVNLRAAMRWRCARNHEWDAPLRKIRGEGTWCKRCGVPGLDIEVAAEVAASRGGECLSQVYENNKTPLEWMCERGHTWMANLNNVKDNKTWCPHCSEVAPLTIEDAKATAAERGGECLSEEYVNYRRILRWRCGEGHHWGASYCNVRNKTTWCPACKNKAQQECADTVALLLGPDMMTNCWPEFMRCGRYPRGLELDIYYPELGLAIEYQGAQHSEYIPHFHRGGVVDLHAQQERDRDKLEMCEKNWVTLVRVWHHENMVTKLVTALAELGYL